MKKEGLATNFLTPILVSFVALTLGASFGILSGRENGAFIGMVSAGIIAFITALLGGTRVQCSGPTAPMTAVIAVVVAFAVNKLPSYNLSISQDHFINIVLLLTGGLLIVMALLKFGRYIKYVPNIVVSGFMSGIAILIFLDQINNTFGLSGKTPFEGSMSSNIAIVIATLGVIILLPQITRKFLPRYANYLSPTLFSIIIVSAIANASALDVEYVNLNSTINSFSDFTNMVQREIPNDWSWGVLKLALPFAVQLALLGYLDTMLTSLVIDRITGENTKQSKELAAQGVASGLVALVGGIPGAQATIRSVLIIREGATLRLAGVLVGVFVLIEIAIFKDLINHIPAAVFAGVLFKVGYDVFDFTPFRLYWQELKKLRLNLIRNFFSRHSEARKFVTNREMLMILGTIILTVFYNLNVAVITFTAIFYLVNKVFWTSNPIRDLEMIEETEAIIGEPIIESVIELDPDHTKERE